VAALLFQILDFIELEPTVVPEELTCTQLLQQWHVLSNDKLETALLFDQVIFSKATSIKEKVYKPDYNNPAPAFAKDVKEQEKNPWEQVASCRQMSLLPRPVRISGISTS
jgi:hypothetical protein